MLKSCSVSMGGGLILIDSAIQQIVDNVEHQPALIYSPNPLI